MSGLELDPEKGDGRAVQVLFDAAWKDWKAGGNGLTHAELMDYARLHLNMSGTFQRYRDWQSREGGHSTAVADMAVEWRPDRTDPAWVAVAHWSGGRAYARMTRNQPSGNAGRDRLLVAANRSRGGVQPPADQIRWTVNVKDGKPVLPRVWHRAIQEKERWDNYDPEAEKIGVAGHMETLAWLQEAREEVARAKRRPTELHSLVERAIAIFSVTGR